MLKHIAAAGVAAIALGVALPASAELAETYSPDAETVVGGREVFLPSVPLTPARYVLPMEVYIVQDSSVTTDTPITDALADDIPAWSEAVRGCLVDKPVMRRAARGGEVPFVVGGAEGTIQLNAGGNPVCSL